MNRRAFAITLVAATIVFLVAFFWGRTPTAGSRDTAEAAANPATAPATESVDSTSRTEADAARAELVAAAKAKLQREALRRFARKGETTLRFKDDAAYRAFLDRAAREGIPILGKIDRLHAVRVGSDAFDGIANDLVDHSGDYDQVAANYTLTAPGVTPEAQDRAARVSVPVRNQTLSVIGATGDNSTWGRGVTIAVIDSGIQSDPTFGAGRLQYLDIGLGVAPGTDGESGHGTAVAALAAGASPDAQGVAPSANLLSIRVADASGTSDIFSVAQAIVAAVDRGAQVLNISLGGYGTNSTLDAAITYALSQGAVIVAAAGNDQAAQLAWPAADPRVISVGAVDAVGEQVIFSNSGPQLQITAPGYAVQTAWTDGKRVYMDGTSASAPIVSGAIAAIMSTTPGTTASDAWKVLQQYASDGGPAGDDPDYGNGVLNLGWAMSRNDLSRIDTAISSHYYDAASGTLQVVVQNRSGQAVSGLNLDVAVNGATSGYAIPSLNPGAEQVIKIPVQSALNATGSAQVVTLLNNPSTVTDQIPANNRRASTITLNPTK